MKIHNIRTFNLNSLYGEFTVDLDDLLSGASLFLIYGPTGSGKSTLMDAVSLALFGQTPRLDDKSGTESRKPHAIMSRGTGMCSASVQFSKLASEGRQTFRAIWTCHRSRKKAGQKPQQAQRSLEILKDGEWELLVSSTKKKVYKAAFDKVLEGFSVQDFNRSMLLAQGQFDAFLGAPPKERAEILERLTDTSVYQQVGERAATIHRRHERRLLALRTLAAADAGLSEQQLSDLEQAHVLNQAQLARANEQHQRCLSALQWLGQALELEEQLQKAKGQQLQLQERQATAKPALDRLAEHERCVVQRAFHLLDDFGRAKDRASVAVRQLKELDALIPELKTKELADGGRAQGQRRVFEAAELDLQRMRPVVALAQRTGEELSAVSGRVRVAKTALERAAKLVLAGELATRKASGVVVDARKRAFSANLEVDQHVADARLLRAWAPLRVRLVTLVAALRQASSRALVLQDGRRSLTVDRQSWKDDSAVFQTSESATLEPLARGVQVAQAHLLGLLEGEDLQPARERRSTLIVAGRSRLQLVQLTVSPTENALRGAGDLARLQGDVFGRRGLFDKAGVQVSSILTLVEREELAVRRDEVAHDRVVRVASLVEHRSALVDGEACPLCGAQEHPWSADSDRAAGDREIREHLAASARALEASRARHSEAVSRHREARELVGRHHAALGLLRGQEQRATETLVDLRAARARALQTADMVQDGVAELTDAELVESVGNVVDAVRREVALAEAAMRELDGARQRHQDAQDAMSGAKESRAHESAVLDRRQAALQERGEQLQRDLLVLSASREDAETEGLACKGVALDLGLSFHGHDPDLWRIMGEERCAAQQLREAALVQANGLAFAAETELNAKVQVADERRSASAQRALELEDLGIEAKEKGDRTDAAMGALHELWSVVVSSDDRRVGEASTLASAEPKELLEAQTGWHDRAKASADATFEIHQRSQRGLQTVLQQRALVSVQEAELRVSRDSAGEELNAVVHALDLATDGALESARLGSVELAEARTLSGVLQADHVQVTTRIAERSHRAQEHAGTRPADLDDEIVLDDLKAKVGAAAEQRQEASRLHLETGDSLRDHHNAVQKQGKARDKLVEAEREARVWHTLHSYIGKNDGEKFKQFAQALNLGQLLDKANVHLARLSNRYQLVPRLEEGLPTLEFDLLDRWQAGERVAPRSLSGGERFLVSLSLALGLSDFRSVKMPIETLLLDEGFGTLDSTTLGTALDALSQLQADGRQVGIISHVVGLRERIPVTIEVRPLGGGRSEVVA